MRATTMLLLAAAGMVGMVSAVQVVHQGAAEPPGKTFLAKVGFETQLWVDVPLFLVGLAGFLVAAALVAKTLPDSRRAG